jgi:hypothetical protein
MESCQDTFRDFAYPCGSSRSLRYKNYREVRKGCQKHLGSGKRQLTPELNSSVYPWQIRHFSIFFGDCDDMLAHGDKIFVCLELINDRK